LASVLEKRHTLHRQLAEQQTSNNQLKSQVEQLETLANLGMVSAMIAHEINNILTPLGSYAQLAMRHPEDEALIHKTIQKTAANSQRASKILESMLAMATGVAQPKADHRLKALVDDVFVCLARDFSRDNISVTIEIPEDLTISAQGVCFQQVLMNLILNAREAMLGTGGELKISARQLPDSVQIEIADTGRGIEPENLARIFEPFYTTKNGQSKSVCSGAGLGLAFCKNVIDGHDGIISVESNPTGETTFTIILRS
jgi:two-component system NtrC family sensor kinase